MKDSLGKDGWRITFNDGQENTPNPAEQRLYMPQQATTENKEHLENGSH